MSTPCRRAGLAPRGRCLAALLAAAGLALLPLTARPDPTVTAPPSAVQSLNQGLLAEEVALQFFNLNQGKPFLTAASAAAPGAAAGADLTTLTHLVMEIGAGHQAHVTMLQQMLGAQAPPMPAFLNLQASSLPQFLTLAQMIEGIDVGVQQGVLLSALQSGNLNPLGGTTGGAATPPAANPSGPGIDGVEIAILADDARYEGGIRAFVKTISTSEGGSPNTLLTPTGAPLSPGLSFAQAAAALQPFLVSSTPAPAPAPPGGTTTPPAPTVSFSRDILRIFTNNGAKTCARPGCHGGASPQLGQNLEAASAYASIVNVPSVEKPSLLRVKPGDAANSYLFQKITGAPGIAGSRMPLVGGPLAASDIALIQQWINAGAPNN